MTIEGQGGQELFYRFIFAVHWRKSEASASGDGEGVEGEDEGQQHHQLFTLLREK